MLWDEIRSLCSSAKSSAFALKYCTTYRQRGLQRALIGHLWYWLPAACQSRCYRIQVSMVSDRFLTRKVMDFSVTCQKLVRNPGHLTSSPSGNWPIRFAEVSYFLQIKMYSYIDSWFVVDRNMNVTSFYGCHTWRLTTVVHAIRREDIYQSINQSINKTTYSKK